MSQRFPDWPARLQVLDISRGLAALGVVFWHWRHFAYDGTTVATGFRPEQMPGHGVLRLFYDLGWMGVEYFFLLSGFVFFWLYGEAIRLGKVTAWGFAVQRFSRLYPLHLATLLVVAALQGWMVSRTGSTFVYQHFDLPHFALNACFATSWGFERTWSFNGPSWSVSVEVLLYAGFFLFARWTLGGWGTCLAISLGAFAGHVATNSDLLKGVALFWFGGILHRVCLVLTSPRGSPLRLPLFAVTGLLWAAVLVDCYAIDLVRALREGLGPAGKALIRAFPGYLLFPATLCSLVVWEVAHRPVLRRLTWIGDLTYASYLLHFPLQLVFVLVADACLGGRWFYLQPWGLVLFFTLLIPLSCVAFHGFELPTQSFLRHLLRRRERRTEARG